MQHRRCVASCDHLVMSAGIFDATKEKERRDFTGGDVAFAPNSEKVIVSHVTWGVKA